MPNINVITAAELGWQEMGFNMNNPVFGTGVDTPLGKSNPSQAAESARLVRKAISHLIPRDQIVSQLLGGSGYSLASFLGPGWGIWYDSTLSPDTYDLGAAADDLRAAGYTPLITATASVTSTSMTQSTSASMSMNTSMAPSTTLLTTQPSTTTQAATGNPLTSIPGFPIESIILGLVIAMFILAASRTTARRRPG